MPFYTYIARCGDGTFYTGWTDDLDKRAKAHNDGKGGRYTRSRRPVEIIYSEPFASKSEAMSRERAIKKMRRPAKESLIEKERTPKTGTPKKPDRDKRAEPRRAREAV
jgi:putative endonuclease